MTKTLAFIAFGEPAPQGSKVVYNGRPVESSKKLKPWRAAVALAAEQAMREQQLEPFTGPVVAEVVFLLPRPKTVTREWPETKPDTDKMQRGIGDALSVDSKVLGDDSKIVLWAKSGKIYADIGRPGAAILIREAQKADLASLEDFYLTIATDWQTSKKLA